MIKRNSESKLSKITTKNLKSPKPKEELNKKDAIISQVLFQKITKLELQLSKQIRNRQDQFNELHYQITILNKNKIKKRKEKQQLNNNSTFKKISKKQIVSSSSILKTDTRDDFVSPMKNKTIEEWFKTKKNLSTDSTFNLNDYTMNENLMSRIQTKFVELNQSFDKVNQQSIVLNKKVEQISKKIESSEKKTFEFLSLKDQRIQNFQAKSKELNDFLMDQLLQVFQKLKKLEGSEINFFENMNSELEVDTKSSLTSIKEEQSTKSKLYKENFMNKISQLSKYFNQSQRNFTNLNQKVIENEGLLGQFVQLVKSLSQKLNNMSYISYTSQQSASFLE